jgi:iron-sulfur cluster repair protein YtfE (RIC family)
MALVHNIFIKGYNSIYLQAPCIVPGDIPDFIHYCLAWYQSLKDHHNGEEELLFPLIEEGAGVKGIMDGEREEHGKLA